MEMKIYKCYSCKREITPNPKSPEYKRLVNRHIDFEIDNSYACTEHEMISVGEKTWFLYLDDYLQYLQKKSIEAWK